MSEVKRSMVGHAVRLMKAGRAAGLPIFFAKVNHRSDGATAVAASHRHRQCSQAVAKWRRDKTRARVSGDDKSSDPIPELEPQAGDYFIPKYRWNAFFQTALDLSLRSREIDTVIISGGSTEIGLTATVFGGRDLDYNMIVVRDACASFHDQRAHDTSYGIGVSSHEPRSHHRSGLKHAERGDRERPIDQIPARRFRQP